MQRTVLIGNLPGWAGDEDVKAWLEAADIICDDVRVVRDLETQESKGYALAEAASDEDEEAMIKRFHRAPIDGRVLQVVRASAAGPAKRERRPAKPRWTVPDQTPEEIEPAPAI